MSNSIATAACGKTPSSFVATVCANQFTNPTRVSPSASATKVANHTSVFQAAKFFVMSPQVTTLVTSINEMMISAAVVALTSSARKIQSTSASTTKTASMIS